MLWITTRPKHFLCSTDTTIISPASFAWSRWTPSPRKRTTNTSRRGARTAIQDRSNGMRWPRFSENVPNTATYFPNPPICWSQPLHNILPYHFLVAFLNNFVFFFSFLIWNVLEQCEKRPNKNEFVLNLTTTFYSNRLACFSFRVWVIVWLSMLFIAFNTAHSIRLILWMNSSWWPFPLTWWRFTIQLFPWLPHQKLPCQQ